MAFTSIAFLVFVPVTLIVYYLLPGKVQWLALLAASYVFYLQGSGSAVVWLIGVTLLTWGSAMVLERLNETRKHLPEEGKKQALNRIKRQKRLVVWVQTLCCFGLLFVMKYWNFTAELLEPLVGTGKLPMWNFLMPLGLSFFIFQAVGYVVDVYRGKTAAERNPLKLALFTSFFPQMVQGPISRYEQLAPQLLAPHKLDCTELKYGIQLAIWGYMKKIIIADRAAVVVSTVVDNPWAYGGAIQAVGILFYCIQLFCDFSGGIDITRGVAQMFGIDLMENFKRPVFATSLADYWRRWHITLGSWMRDYVFYPLSLSKPFGKLGKFTRKHIGGKVGKIFPTSVATFVVYFIIGIWHGANFRYLAFGLWNGVLITAAMLLEPRFERMKRTLHIREESRWYRLFQMARTCLIVFFGRYITRAPRLLTAVWMARQTFVHPHLSDLWNGTLLNLGLTMTDLIVVFAGVAVILGVELYQERGGKVRASLEKKNGFVQWLAILLPLLALLFLGILRAEDISSGFIYAQY